MCWDRDIWEYGYRIQCIIKGYVGVPLRALRGDGEMFKHVYNWSLDVKSLMNDLCHVVYCWWILTDSWGSVFLCEVCVYGQSVCIVNKIALSFLFLWKTSLTYKEGHIEQLNNIAYVWGTEGGGVKRMYLEWKLNFGISIFVSDLYIFFPCHKMIEYFVYIFSRDNNNNLFPLTTVAWHLAQYLNKVTIQ